jgi:hypothetical protein
MQRISASFLKVSVFIVQTNKTMKTKTSEIPALQKIKIVEKETVTTCCAPKTNAEVCCTPSVSKEENNGACCAQPADGTSCCDK